MLVPRWLRLRSISGGRVDVAGAHDSHLCGSGSIVTAAVLGASAALGRFSVCRFTHGERARSEKTGNKKKSEMKKTVLVE